MKIDLDHLHHWMCAIRESNYPIRTLDAFWHGQLKSKLWLIDNLRPFINKPATIEIHGGWVGVLASLLFQSNLPVIKITNIDFDVECESIARSMNRLEFLQNKFESITINMIEYPISADIVINTSCEHITQNDYSIWRNKVPTNSLIVLQSNDYNISEHIRTVNNLQEFINQSNLKSILYADELILPLYKRFMIIGK